MPKFYNIFSSKKEKTRPYHDIVIDHREKQAIVATELIAKRIPVTFEQLEVGDYLIGTTIVERKTIKDLASSIKTKRFFTQIDELARHQNTLLIVEGLEDTHLTKSSGMHENIIRGTLLWTAMIKQIPLLYTYNERDTAYYLELLARIPSDKKQKARPKKRAKNKDEQVRFILEGFPGIGNTTATHLLTHFPSLKHIAKAKERELVNLMGKKGKTMHELLTHTITQAP